LARHDRAARDLLAAYHGREIDKSDGFLLLFERPIEAVRFAIAYRARPLEVEGLAKAIAARVMSLAGGGRILLTRAAYDFARRAAVGTDEESSLRWAVHGAYQLA